MIMVGFLVVGVSRCCFLADTKGRGYPVQTGGVKPSVNNSKNEAVQPHSALPCHIVVQWNHLVSISSVPESVLPYFLTKRVDMSVQCD